MKVAKLIIAVAVLVMAQLATAQQQQQSQSQLSIGENTKLNAGGLFTFGYAGDYGDAIPSTHGLDFGFDGRISGSYYNPNFLSFTANPYYDQSRNDSSYQSITGASGVTGTANFFTGSNFPGSVTYHYDRNSTGTLGLTGQPNFTTIGKSQGFGVNWSAMLPGLPTLAVGYSQGSGHSTLFGTDQESDGSTHLFNVHSTYAVAGFRLNAYFTRNSFSTNFPSFLSEQAQAQDASNRDFGVGAQHTLPMHGSFYVNYNRSSATTNYATNGGGENTADVSSYTDNTETANATFHPTQKFAFNVTENVTDNLNGYLAQTETGGIPVPGVNVGSGSHSYTTGGGASYQFTKFLAGGAQATYYDQAYFGKSYTGEYLSGTLTYGKRLLDTFTFSGSVIDSSNGQGQNALGFIGNVNMYHKFGRWQASGQVSYAQNVQTLLVTYTTSYYQYSANISRRLPGGMAWIASFNGSHSGLSEYFGNSNHSEGYSTSLSMRRVAANAFYTRSSGISLLGAGGIITPTPTPGLSNVILFSGDSYGGGLSVTPIKRLSIAASFTRALSNTLAATDSRNNTEIFNAQMQYHLRRIGLQAGYTRFTQGISAIGAPVNNTTYFVGMTRWFNFF